MSKNVNWVGIQNLKVIIRDLGIRQKELTCDGVHNISQVLTGKKAITEKVSAPALVERIYKIANEKGIILPYDVTVGLLRGETNIIQDDIIKNLSSVSSISTKLIDDVDNNLKNLSNKESIEFLNQVIGILNKNACANAKLMRKYSLKLLRLDLSYENTIHAYRTLIKAYSYLRKYDDVISVAENIEDLIERCTDKEAKISFYRNIGVAYYKEKRYEESTEYFKKLKPLEKGDEFFYLTLECAIRTMKEDFKKAENLCFRILDLAKTRVNNDYTVDGYSKLADLYNRMELKDKAKEYVDYALDNISCGTSKVFRFNAYFNAFEIYNELGEDRNKIEEIFLKAYPLAIELNYLDKIEMLFETAFNMYFEQKEYTQISNMLKQVKHINIKSEILEKTMRNIAESL